MEFEPLDEQIVTNMQPLILAMIGDSVHTLFVREYIIRNFNAKVNKVNKMVSSIVNAGAQFTTMQKIMEKLTEKEKNIVNRARNTHIHSKSKNYSVHEYIYATGYEALIGYLYLIGNKSRLQEVLSYSVDGVI